MRACAEPAPRRVRARARSPAERGRDDAPLPQRPELEFFNGLGGFAADGRST